MILYTSQTMVYCKYNFHLHWEIKKIMGLIYCNICYLAVVWNQTHTISKVCLHYSALKRNELSSHEKTQRKFKYIILGEGANLKRLRIIFQLCDVLEKAKLWKQ